MHYGHSLPHYTMNIYVCISSEKRDKETLDELRQHIQTPEQVIAAIHNINSSEVCESIVIKIQ